MLKTSLLAGATLIAVLLAAGQLAADGLRIAPVTDPVVKKECGACHMVYPPGLLPARSWSAMMKGLDTHFGDNAELDAALAKTVEDYLVANAGDRTTRAGRMFRDLAPTAAPLRISELRWFVREHDGNILSPASLTRKNAKFKGDCKACHSGAERSLFDDDEHDGRHERGRDRRH